MQLASLRSFSFKVQGLNLHGKSQVESPHCLQSSNRLITSVSMVHMLLKHSACPLQAGSCAPQYNPKPYQWARRQGPGKGKPCLTAKPLSLRRKTYRHNQCQPGQEASQSHSRLNWLLTLSERQFLKRKIKLVGCFTELVVKFECDIFNVMCNRVTDMERNKSNNGGLHSFPVLSSPFQLHHC